MAPSAYPAIVFTVVLLVTNAYFLMGGLPLLVLQHDTPLDQAFVQRFFDIYFKVSLFAAAGATLSYSFWGQIPFAMGAAFMTVLAVLMRRKIVPAMAELGARIQAHEASAVREFRKIHAAALLLNLLQLVVIVWGITKLSV